MGCMKRYMCQYAFVAMVAVDRRPWRRTLVVKWWESFLFGQAATFLLVRGSPQHNDTTCRMTTFCCRRFGRD